MKDLKVLCIHGIGGKDRTMLHENSWTKDWRKAFSSMRFTSENNIHFMEFDTFFDEYDADISDYLDFFTTAFLQRRSQKGLIDDWFSNYPDMVVEFLTTSSIRVNLRNSLKNLIDTIKPNVIYAHSLGSMMCYDFFMQPENNSYKNITLVTAGSQLGNRRLHNFGIKHPLSPLPIKYWYNLNNPNDMVFAKNEICLPSNANYIEVSTPFQSDIINHNGLKYLNHPEAISNVWKQIQEHQKIK